MTVVTEHAGRRVAHVKGSFDVILARSTHVAIAGGQRPITEADRARVQAEADRLAGAALRVLALADRVLAGDEDPESGLVFLGLPPAGWPGSGWR